MNGAVGRAGLKICGLTRPDDVRVCDELGVDAIGINLWPRSPRGLDLAAAETLLAACPSGPARRVGIFVDPEPAFVTEAIARLGLDLVQLHGDRDVRDYLPLSVPYVWVIRGSVDLAALVVPVPAPAWVLLDAGGPGFGGTGARLDWAWAARAVARLAPTPVWLAGGITAANAATALSLVRPAGLDVASGAENGVPGHKDRAMITALRRICDAAAATRDDRGNV